VFARPWRLGLNAVAAFFGWNARARIVVSPMSDDWLRQLDASRRSDDW
jgi:hypothetical protein